MARCCWRQRLSAQMPCAFVSLSSRLGGPGCKRHRGCGRCARGRETRFRMLCLCWGFKHFVLFLLFFLLSLCISLTLRSRPLLVYFCPYALAWRAASPSPPFQQMHTSHSYDLTDTEQFVMIRLPSNNETESETHKRCGGYPKCERASKEART